jgi:hypothetical protein
MPVPAEPTPDDQILVRYLLGSLPAEQSERLDELSVSDDDFVWRMRAAENDLVDAYLRNELSGDRLERFRSFYLASAHRREKVKFAEALLALGAQEPQGSRNWFAAPSMIPRWVAASGIAAAVLLAGVLLYENGRLRNQVQQAERQRASLTVNRGQAAAPDAPLVAMVLKPPVRGGGPIPEVSVPAGVLRAVFALRLETDDSPAYVAALKNAGGNESLWRSEELKSASGAVSVSVPANLLRAGDYVLQLSPAGPNSEPLANYVFRVTVR